MEAQILLGKDHFGKDLTLKDEMRLKRMCDQKRRNMDSRYTRFKRLLRLKFK